MTSPLSKEQARELLDTRVLWEHLAALRECRCHGCETEHLTPLLEVIPVIITKLESALSTAIAERRAADVVIEDCRRELGLHEGESLIQACESLTSQLSTSQERIRELERIASGADADGAVCGCIVCRTNREALFPNTQRETT